MWNVTIYFKIQVNAAKYQHLKNIIKCTSVLIILFFFMFLYSAKKASNTSIFFYFPRRGIASPY